ncbi:MAG: helix-turn-helix domain-containing protein [Saprospiraceae bacterium]|nr:helix-turn-helix domain-containing protein [Saprospiraceae bacterium]MCB9320915.1 helix-turn-helix domain-containing protein [Lewinellaceae bacterium]
MENIINTAGWAALIQGILLAMLYLFSRKHRSLANRILGLFLLVIVYEGILEFLPGDPIGSYNWYYFAFPEVKIFYPVLFFNYILEKVGRSNHYRKFLRFHYFLAIAFAAITLVNVALYLGTHQKIEAVLGEDLVSSIFMIQQYYAFLLILIVFGLSIKEVLKYRQIIRRNYSDNAMLNINWLWRFIFVLLPIILVWGINLIWIALGGKYDHSYEIITWCFVIVFLYFVSFQAYQHKNLFDGEQQIPGEEYGNSETAHDEEPQVGQPENIAMIQTLRRHMEMEEPYLNASLTIYQLARELSISVPELSTLINHSLHQHFFDFVNEYRIKKATELLKDPEKQKLTILEILYEVGFNSKSSFNTVFKKFTGSTPTEYRKKFLVVVDNH